MKNSFYDIFQLCSFPIIILLAFGIGFMSLVFSFEQLRHQKGPASDLYDIVWIPFGNSKIRTIVVSVLCILVLVVSNSALLYYCGYDDLRIAPEGTYCYYVKATGENGSTYTLPAKIEKIEKDFYVHNIYFNNGGYLYFDSGDYVSFDDKVSNYDQNGKEWKIELTNNKTTHPMVKESNNTSILYVIEMVAQVVLAISVLIACILYMKHLTTDQ